jgi:hypothetical protein
MTTTSANLWKIADLNNVMQLSYSLTELSIRWHSRA